LRIEPSYSQQDQQGHRFAPVRRYIEASPRLAEIAVGVMIIGDMACRASG
jgi:hypothetical protein